MVEKEIEMAELKDSGERRTFESGAIRELCEGKGRCDLLPLDTVSYILALLGYKQEIFKHLNAFLKTSDVENLRRAILLFCEWTEKDPLTMLLELAIHFEDGARKYSDNNWRKGTPVHIFIDSGIRHYIKWLRGDQDEPHDRAFIWNMVCAIWTMENKPELNDISEY